MIYLTTGANGSGKTLLTLKDVREQQLKENRPVYYHGFEMDEAKAAEFGWKPFDPKKWQDLPDGSICVMDECQNEFPLRRSGSEVPDYVNAVAQFRRKRGFDFWMISPHPSLIDVFIRRLIDKPSWHRHLKRTFGADMVSVLKFSAPDMKCEDPGAGSRGEVSMRSYPKDVYSWYKSASLHTGKKKIPRAVYMLIGAAILGPAALYYAVSGVYGNVKSKAPVEAAKQGAAMPVSDRPVAAASKMTVDEYLAVRKPRLPDFPHTAAAYDTVTQPVVAPYPAACIFRHESKSCTCYSQQGTVLHTSGEVCMQIVKNGFFVDWQQPQQLPPVQRQMVKDETGRPVGVSAPKVVDAAPAKQLDQPRPLTWSEGLAIRNAQVRSAFN